MKLFLILISLLGVYSEKAKFYNYQVHRLMPETELHVRALVNLSYTNEYIYLTFPTRTGRAVDIVVPPHTLPDFQDFVDLYKFPQIIRSKNYQSLLDEEEKILSARAKQMDWTTYHSLDEIYEWMNELSQKYPEVRTVLAGKTYEGREIRGIEITFGKNFTGIFIESGIHACEWIGPAGTSWMVNEILNSPPDSIFRQFNYVYVPVFNPDGYVYSWEKNRLWRKTRTPYRTDNKICYGADPNRNWNLHWDEAGAGQSPCSGNYPGPEPFSEIETKSLSEFISSVIKPMRIDLYFAFHSYYQMLLYPWGGSPDLTPLRDTWQRIGEAAVADLTAVHGTKFSVGDGYHSLWPMRGCSKDWVYGNFNLTITFMYEMRDTGDFAFVLPSKNIVPVGEEHLASIKRVLIEYLKLGVTKTN